MAYSPAPINAWDANLVPYLLAELNRISDEFQNIRDGNFLRLWNVEPPKPREGQIIAVDGTAWTPGAGAGIYSYTGGAWVKL